MCGLFGIRPVLLVVMATLRKIHQPIRLIIDHMAIVDQYRSSRVFVVRFGKAHWSLVRLEDAAEALE